MAHGIPARLTPSEGRKFGLTVGGAFLALAALLWWRGLSTPSIAAATLGAALLLAAVLAPGRLGPVQSGWMRFGLLLSKVTTPVFMGIVYFVVLTPTGLIRRSRGLNALSTKVRDGGYWHPRDRSRPSNLARQF